MNESSPDESFHILSVGNPVSEFPTGFFASFEKLMMFYCSNCNLGPTLHSGSLEFNSQDLDLVLLDGNNIETVEPGAFSGILNPWGNLLQKYDDVVARLD